MPPTAVMPPKGPTTPTGPELFFDEEILGGKKQKRSGSGQLFFWDETTRRERVWEHATASAYPYIGPNVDPYG